MGRGAISKRSWSQTMNDSSTDPQTMISNKKQKFEETAKAANFSVSFEEYLKNVLEKAIPHFSVEAELFAKEETIRKMENHMANVPEHLKKAFAMEERISSEKRNLLKLLSKRYRLLNPVSLCPSLYSEVLANAIAENSAVMPDYEKAKKIITTIFNVGMSGKDGFFAMAQLFKKLRTLFFADNFAGIKFECSYFDFPLIVNNSKEIKDLLLKILEMGIPHVTKVHFSTSSRPWVQLFFAILAKHPQQTKLDIHGNVGADFVVPRTVEKLARRGVMIGLRSQTHVGKYKMHISQIGNNKFCSQWSYQD
uniref:Uncharacterized protein n=1 Tax=Panagrolaimus sp. JU765 TaxID=591449 RepID=A0AC34R5T4_9BILA